MIKNLRKNVFLLFIVLCTIISSVFIISKNINYNKDHDVNLRTVTLEENQVNAESYFEAFDDYEIKKEKDTFIFNGVKNFSLSDFEEYDNISINQDEKVITNYQCEIDEKTKSIILTISLEINGDIEIASFCGDLLYDEEINEFNAIFNIEGQLVLLSDLLENNTIDNVGWLFKAIKKVLSHPTGVVGAILTVAACAAVGVGVAMTGGALGAAILAGAAVGAALSCATAVVSTGCQNNWKSVDWDTVAIYTGTGAVAGAIISSIAYGITCAISDVPTMRKALKLSDNNSTSKTTFIGKFIGEGDPTNYVEVAKTNNGNYFSMSQEEWVKLSNKYGNDFMTELNKNFITGKFNAGNEFIATQDPNIANGAFGNEVQWLKDLCGAQGKTCEWEKIGESLWKFIVH